jgi:hypothetical protein
MGNNEIIEIFMNDDISEKYVSVQKKQVGIQKMKKKNK